MGISTGHGEEGGWFLRPKGAQPDPLAGAVKFQVHSAKSSEPTFHCKIRTKKQHCNLKSRG